MKIMKLTTEHAQEIEKAIRANDGYCCCAIEKNPDTKCICKDFADKMEDPNYEGECLCGLYLKTK